VVPSPFYFYTCEKEFIAKKVLFQDKLVNVSRQLVLLVTSSRQFFPEPEVQDPAKLNRQLQTSFSGSGNLKFSFNIINFQIAISRSS
jgi:hypothetical protein